MHAKKTLDANECTACLQAGTLSGNPLAMTAGLKTLEILDRPGSYEHLDSITGKLIDGILQAGRDAGHAVTGGHISGTDLFRKLVHTLMGGACFLATLLIMLRTGNCIMTLNCHTGAKDKRNGVCRNVWFLFRGW